MDIYTNSPINKIAATVVNQSGCTSHEGLSDSQKRDVLIKRVLYLNKQVHERGKNFPGYELMRREIQSINSKLSGFKKKHNREFHHFLLDVINEVVTKQQWKMWVEEAESRYQKAVQNKTGQKNEN